VAYPHLAPPWAGFFYQPQAFATRRGEADFVTVLDGALKTLRRNGTLAVLSKKWYHGLDVSARPGPGVPLFSKALAMLKAGTYPLQ
jgi:ABC-type amino acid transport substrate-binding protein